MDVMNVISMTGDDIKNVTYNLTDLTPLRYATYLPRQLELQYLGSYWERYSMGSRMSSETDCDCLID